jgi:hypothetical protein
MSLRRTIAAGLALAAAASAPAGAFETPGSRNFIPPGYVPNFFSNEGAPFLGYAAPRPPAAIAAPLPSVAAPVAPPAAIVAAPRPPAPVFVAPPVAAAGPPRRTVVVIARNSYRIIGNAAPSRGPTRTAARAGRVAATVHAATRRPSHAPAAHAFVLRGSAARPAAVHGRPAGSHPKRPGRMAAR